MEMTAETEAMKADRLQRAIAGVKAFLQPSTAFTSGHRVYEPDSADASASASMKRDLFNLAFIALEQAEQSASEDTEYLSFDSALYEKIDGKIDPAERPEFRSFAIAIEELIGEINALRV